MFKHNQTIRRQIATKFFECVWPYFGFALKELKKEDVIWFNPFMHNVENDQTHFWSLLVIVNTQIKNYFKHRPKVNSIESLDTADIYEKRITLRHSVRDHYLKVSVCSYVMTLTLLRTSFTTEGNRNSWNIRYYDTAVIIQCPWELVKFQLSF